MALSTSPACNSSRALFKCLSNSDDDDLVAAEFADAEFESGVTTGVFASLMRVTGVLSNSPASLLLIVRACCSLFLPPPKSRPSARKGAESTRTNPLPSFLLAAFEFLVVVWLFESAAVESATASPAINADQSKTPAVTTLWCGTNANSNAMEMSVDAQILFDI